MKNGRFIQQKKSSRLVMWIFLERALSKPCRENQNCHFEKYKARRSNGRFSYRSSIYLSFIGIKVLVIKHPGSISGTQKHFRTI